MDNLLGFGLDCVSIYAAKLRLSLRFSDNLNGYKQSQNRELKMGRAELMLVGGLILAGYAVYLFVSSLINNNLKKDILSWSSGTEPVKSKSGIINLSRPLIHNFTLQHAVKIKNENYRNKIDQELLAAGLKSELNVDEFIGMQLLWGVMFPLLVGVMNFSLEMGIPWIAVLAFMGFGYYIPTMYCKQMRTARIKKIRSDLPFYADLLALSTKAGLDLISALQRLVEKGRGSVLADELATVLGEINLGTPRVEALKRMADRIDMTEVTSFIAVIVDAEQTGSSLYNVLKDQSEQMRLERLLRAEKAGEEAAQNLMLPIILFIVPAIMIIVLGPAIVQFMGGGK